MENGTGRLVEIARARHTLPLPPRLTAGMTVGANIPTTDPAVIGAVAIWPEVPMRPPEADKTTRSVP